MTTFGLSRPSSTDTLRASNMRQLPLVEKSLSRPVGSAISRPTRSASALDKYAEEKWDALEQARPASASAALGATLPTFAMRVPPQYYPNGVSVNPSSRSNQTGVLPATPEKENGFAIGSYNSPFEQGSSCSDYIRRTVNTLQFANVADKLECIEDKEQRKNGWHLDEPVLEIVQVLAYMRQRVLTF